MVKPFELEGTHRRSWNRTESGRDKLVVKSSLSADMFEPKEGLRFLEVLAKPKRSMLPDKQVSYLLRTRPTDILTLVNDLLKWLAFWRLTLSGFSS